MDFQPTLQLLISLAATLGINAIPAGLVLLGGNSAWTAMVLYFLENIVSILLAAARVRILAPADDTAYAGLIYETMKVTINGVARPERQIPPTRRRLIVDYVFPSLVFSAGVGVFLFMFVFVVGQHSVPGSVILSGMEGIIALQLVHFVADLALLGPLTPPQAQALLQQSLGRVGLIFFAVFIGTFVAAVNTDWFVIPFVALKTIADLAVLIQAFTARLQKPVPEI